MNKTFIYVEDGIREYISLDKPTIDRINNKPYVEKLSKNLPRESLEALFQMFVKEKTEAKAIASIGNIIEHQTNLGKQKFLHIFVDSKDIFGCDKTFTFLLSNYELLQYEKVNAHNDSVVLTDKNDCLFSNKETFQIMSILFANQNNYKKDWATYHLAKECYLNKNSYNQNLRKDIIDFKKSSPAKIAFGEEVANQLDEEQLAK